MTTGQGKGGVVIREGAAELPIITDASGVFLKISFHTIINVHCSPHGL